MYIPFCNFLLSYYVHFPEKCLLIHSRTVGIRLTAGSASNSTELTIQGEQYSRLPFIPLALQECDEHFKDEDIPIANAIP